VVERIFLGRLIVAETTNMLVTKSLPCDLAANCGLNGR
jgi:hypothetical protein